MYVPVTEPNVRLYVVEAVGEEFETVTEARPGADDPPLEVGVGDVVTVTSADAVILGLQPEAAHNSRSAVTTASG